MKQLILTAVLCLSFFCLSAKNITPQIDTLPLKKWNFGVQASALSDNGYSNYYRLGMFSEYRFSPILSLEGGMNLQKAYFDHKSDFDFGLDYESVNLNITLSAKVRFGKENKWFARLGYYRILNLDDNYSEAYFERYERLPTGDRFIDKHGLELGFGREFRLSNNSAIIIEAILGTRHAGLKLGYRF